MIDLLLVNGICVSYISSEKNASPEIKQKIQDAAAGYASALRAHMDAEEARVFPMINEKMTQTAWNNILGKLKEVKDPIFGEKVSDEFKILYGQIMNA